MNSKKEKIKDAIFLITQEKSCPIYNVGEEIKVSNLGLSASSYKPGCLYLSQVILDILSSKTTFPGIKGIPTATKKTRYSCPGCEGTVSFEYKKDKEYATLQMKLLNDAEEKRKKDHLNKYFAVLRRLPLFESLDDDALRDLTLLLDLKSIPVDRVVVKKDDPPSSLYILLKGEVAVIADDGSTVTVLRDGEIFGEMSLLSGEPVSNSIHTLTTAHLAQLSMKNFRQAIVKYPVIQLFLFRMLVARAQKMALQSGDISSGMTGELAEISSMDLFQLINSAQKTGTIELITNNGRAVVYFNEGQVVGANYHEHVDKDAIFALLPIQQGHFSYSKGIPEGMLEKPPVGDFMGMLMEGLQRIDEE